MRKLLIILLCACTASCSNSGKSWRQTVVTCQLEIDAESGGTYQIIYHNYTHECSGSGSSERRHSVTCGFYYTSMDLTEHRKDYSIYSNEDIAECEFMDSGSQINLSLEYKNIMRASVKTNDLLSLKDVECNVEKSSGDESSVCRYPGGLNFDSLMENVILEKSKANYVGSCVALGESSEQEIESSTAKRYYDGLYYTGIESYFAEDVTVLRDSCQNRGHVWKENDWYTVHLSAEPYENCYTLENEVNGFRGAYKVSWPVDDPLQCSLIYDQDKKVYVKP